MNASKTTVQSQDSRRQDADIDSRYGKIGISAVVAALRQQGILAPSQKTAVWFRQHGAAFRLFPDPAPNRIVYCPLPVRAPAVPALASAGAPVPAPPLSTTPSSLSSWLSSM